MTQPPPVTAAEERPVFPSLPKIVCLCGSLRFYREFQRQYLIGELSGQIVVGPAFSPDVTDHEHGGNVKITPAQKIAVDELHKRKIDLADEVLVLNVGGYIGESTRAEIEYAKRQFKRIRFLEQPDAAQPPRTTGKEGM